MKVILVSTGQYSDYRIVGVFSTPEKVLKFKSKYPDQQCTYWLDQNM